MLPNIDRIHFKSAPLRGPRVMCCGFSSSCLWLFSQSESCWRRSSTIIALHHPSALNPMA